MILVASAAGKVGCADIKGPFFCSHFSAYNECMDSRRIKQILYGVFYLIVLVGIITAVYFWLLKPAPSCFDRTQNQGEQGIDCGGPCAMVCIPQTFQKISVVGNVSAFASAPGHYTLLAQVANANPGLAAPVFDYRFDLYDTAGALLGSVPGTSYLYANEVKYLLAVNVAVPAAVDHAMLVVQDPTWAASTTLGFAPQFKNPLSVTGSAVTASTVSVTGHIVNSDITTFMNILVVAIFRGADGAVLGASQTKIDQLAPNEAQDFSVTYPAAAPSSTAEAIDPSLTLLYAYALR